ncbi:aldehyde dehydrogenase family protein [Actinoplanes sp. NPDC051851]|uniref:aldehyde dehydrogenase family protein n=1 Tax=Actinoplanes sp. NPDC051851 TaxID=3154753 RepID=UPI003447A229
MIESVDPATGERLARFPSSTLDQVTAAVAAARAVQPEWSGRAITERAALIRRWGEVVAARQDEIVDVIHRETGKIPGDALGEVLDVVDGIGYHLDRARRQATEPLELPDEVFPATEATLSARPYGVLGLIMPWNFPFYTPALCLAPALLTGNAVVLKPSEHATMTGRLLRDLADRAGLPAALFTVLPGGDDTGRHLVGAVDKVFFVGSAEAGRDVVRRAGLTPVSLELGGNSAAIVLPDADLDLAAAAIAWGATYHCGQDCAGVKRVLAHRDVAEDLTGRIAAVLTGLVPGTDYGPYISREARDRVEARLADAVAHGAELVLGGERPAGPPGDGNWLTPALVRLRDQACELVREETFGNVVPILAVEDDDAAVAAANESRLSLSAAVFGTDVDRAHRVADRLEAGMVFINDPIVNLPGADHWTGWRDAGDSGLASRYEQCLRRRVTTVHTGGKPRDFWYAPPA